MRGETIVLWRCKNTIASKADFSQGKTENHAQPPARAIRSEGLPSVHLNRPSYDCQAKPIVTFLRNSGGYSKERRKDHAQQMLWNAGSPVGDSDDCLRMRGGAVKGQLNFNRFSRRSKANSVSYYVFAPATQGKVIRSIDND